MKKKAFATGTLFVLIILCVLGYSYVTRRVRPLPTDRSLAVSDLRGSDISRTPDNVPLRFEAVIVNRPEDGCIELFMPDEFQRYDGDPKWAISSKLAFERGLLDRVLESGKGIVSGKYVFVKDVPDGPCGVVTGKLFEISEIEYF